MVDCSTLDNAIKECMSLPLSYQNCEKLAVFFFLRDKLYPEKKITTTEEYSGSEFLDAVGDKPISKIMPILDELMTVVHDLIPTVYNEVISRIERI